MRSEKSFYRYQGKQFIQNDSHLRLPSIGVWLPFGALYFLHDCRLEGTVLVMNINAFLCHKINAKNDDFHSTDISEHYNGAHQMT